MATKTKSAPATVAELRERMLAGDTTITAEDIAHARHAEEFDQFAADATRERELREAEAARLVEVEKLREDVEQFALAHGEAIQQAFERHIQAGRELRSLIDAFNRERAPLNERRRKLRAINTVPLPMLHRKDRILERVTAYLQSKDPIKFRVYSK